MQSRRLLTLATLALLTLATSGGAALAARSMRAPAGVPLPALQARTDPEVIEAGRALVYGAARCSACHGAFGRQDLSANTADVPLTGGLSFDFGPFGVLYAPNLTSDPQTGIGRHSDAELARALRHGVAADGSLTLMMIFEGPDLSDDDLVAVISYLRTLPPLPSQVPAGGLTWLGRLGFRAYGGQVDLDPAPVGVPAADEPSIARGEYLAAEVAGCLGCHSPMSGKDGWHPVEPLASGAEPTPDDGDPGKVHVAPNLTSHPTGVTGRLDEDAFVARMRAGRSLPTSRMPWENVQRMDDVDLRSIYRYLRSLPAADHDTGPTWRDKDWRPGRAQAGASG